ncbi:MAG: CHAP domain-containing protein [Minisyncoccia bacterium]
MLSGVVVTNSYDSNNDFQTGSMLFRYLDGKGGSEDTGTIVIKSGDDTQVKSYVSIAKIASADPNFLANMSSSSSEAIEESAYDVVPGFEDDTDEISGDPVPMVQGNYVLAPTIYYDEALADLKYGIVKYIVQSGDTPSSIATSFGISTYTLLWANNLKVGDYIKPGQELEVLPVTGVKHIVKAGDTVDSIAAKYKADKDEIIIFNATQADGLFPDGSEGKMLIIPNGELAAPLKPRVIVVPRDPNERSVISSAKYKPTNLNPQGGHRFPYGQCTWYVASKLLVPWGGDAKMWLTNSKAYGYKSGKSPVVGSIMVTTENRRYGHVAVVEAVNGDNITISEMNYVGWGRTSVRVLKATSPVIRGYIYVN